MYTTIVFFFESFYVNKDEIYMKIEFIHWCNYDAGSFAFIFCSCEEISFLNLKLMYILDWINSIGKATQMSIWIALLKMKVLHALLSILGFVNSQIVWGL